MVMVSGVGAWMERVESAAGGLLEEECGCGCEPGEEEEEA